MSSTPSRRSLITGAILGAVSAVVADREGAGAQESPKGLRVIAELIAKPGSAGSLRDVLVPFAQGAQKEPGCLHYTLLEVQNDPGHFMTYEIWTDRPALDAHMKTPALAAAGPKLAPLLAKPFTQIFLDALT